MNRSPGCSQDVLRLAGPILIAMAVLSPAARGQCAANELAKLTASDGALGDLFAWSVSVSGDTAIVGARNVADAAHPARIRILTGLRVQVGRKARRWSRAKVKWGMSVQTSERSRT